MMQPTIPPVDRDLLKEELTQDKFLRPTNKAHNEIYVITAHDSPNVMREIGRLREVSFRSWGGGTGKGIDVDDYDFLEKAYYQLIVWDPQGEQIIGGYRFLPGHDATYDSDGQPMLAMGHLFTFSDTFIKDYLPYSVELGRAFIQPDYQTSKMGMKSLFSLDNLWDGLGALTQEVKKAKYFVGKINIYEHYSKNARELIYEYLERFFPDKDCLIKVKNPIEISQETKKLADEIFDSNEGPQANYKILQKAVRNVGETIPPMFNAYIGLTDTMRVFGTTVDPSFGYTFETGIMITMADLLDTKRKRYIEPYLEYLSRMLEERKIAKQNKQLKDGSKKKKRFTIKIR
ncbi:GNAT family N-acetyltransferase [Paludibacteraceae bacterium OttesenSCG-928-F17]|nr:GNAT family N-acetyltransferase [Paludibacteraceae bacterium OttesenSCG-928-F17]